MNNIINNKYNRVLAYAFYVVSGLLVLVGLPLPVQALQVGVNTFNQTARIIYGTNATLVNGNTVRMQDNYPEANAFTMTDVGDSAGRHRRDTSLFTVTLRGYQHGHTIDIRGKLGRTVFRNLSAAEGGSFPDGAGSNSGCRTVTPIGPTAGAGGSANYEFDPGNNNMTQDCSGYSADYRYATIRPMSGMVREVFLDLPGLFSRDEYQLLPPDLYSADVTLNLERWTARVGGEHRFNLPLSIRIRKQAYFTGIALPSTRLPFTVTYVGQTIQGRASTPIVLQGAFDPSFGRVRLSARSDNAFNLRNGSQSIPYQAEVTINQQRFPLNRDGNSAPTITIDNLNDVRQIPLMLEASFNRQRNQVNASGQYSDRLTLIAEVPLV